MAQNANAACTVNNPLYSIDPFGLAVGVEVPAIPVVFVVVAGVSVTVPEGASEAVSEGVSVAVWFGVSTSGVVSAGVSPAVVVSVGTVVVVGGVVVTGAEVGAFVGDLVGSFVGVGVAAARVTVMVYVFVVVPSSAVTFTLTVFFPTDKLVFPVPVTFALESVAVAFTVIEETLLATLTVYAVVPEANFGLNVPVLTDNAFNVASVEIALTVSDLLTDTFSTGTPSQVTNSTVAAFKAALPAFFALKVNEKEN